MSNPSWKDKFTFMAPTGTEHEVQGETLKFYPITVKMLFKLKEIAKPIAASIASLFPQDRKDTGAVYDYADDPEVIPGKERLLHMETKGLSAQMALLRMDEQEKAISGLINTATDRNNMMVLGDMLVDSLRDVFERGSMKQTDIDEFISQMPLPVMKDMLTGLIKANAKVLGPLGEKVSQIMNTAIEDRLATLEKPEATIAPKEREPIAPLPSKVKTPATTG